jgi:hypothetical protein
MRKLGYDFLAEFEQDVSPAFGATIVKTGGGFRRRDKFSAPVLCVIHLRSRYGLALSSYLCRCVRGLFIPAPPK